ncbi:MAG: metalloregulator ArsR/SmtB family transcription factor [Archangium sp.]
MKQNDWKNLKRSVPVFAALGDETRLSMLGKLSREGPQSIARLSAGSDVTRQAITKHLRVLEDAGLVSSKRDGREAVFAVEPEGFERSKELLDLISRRWDETLERLREFVE